MWWEGVKGESAKRRRTEGCIHASSGHKVAWEDCLVMVFGVDWTDFRDGHKSLEHWMQNFAYFSKNLCDRWHLPESALVFREPWKPLTCISEYELEDTPMPKLPLWCCEFQTEAQGILFLVDCKSVADLSNGVAELFDPDVVGMIC